MGDLELVAFDIETTGFDVDDVVTVAGFRVPLGCRILVQTDGRQPTGLETRVQEHTDCHVVLSTHESERELLDVLAEFVRTRLAEDDILLVAYNGETWNGGFDLPFLRTRCSAHQVSWPFANVPYADLYPLFDDLFNTTVDGSASADLETVYDRCIEGRAGQLDPFADSSEAVRAFEAGEFQDVVLHNIADIRRTAQLGALAQRYCSNADFNVKSLTPASEG